LALALGLVQASGGLVLITEQADPEPHSSQRTRMVSATFVPVPHRTLLEGPNGHVAN